MNPPTDQTLGLPAPGVRYLGGGHECHPSRGSTISGTKNGAKLSSLLDSLAGNKIAYGAWKPLKSEDSASAEKNSYPTGSSGRLPVLKRPSRSAAER